MSKKIYNKVHPSNARFDEDGYEIGYDGPDIEKGDIIEGEERERMINFAKRGPIKRFFDRLTA